jgi:ferritin-like metal-binding protein YciE
MNASQKISQYLGEAKASEDALVRVLQSQIAMTPAGSYRSGLERHLEETRDHSRRLSDRIGELTGGRDPVGMFVGLAEELLGQTLALAKTPIDLMRGSGGEEKVLKNAKDAAATEALEIATYTAIERLASSLDDDQTADLARGIRRDEEKMLALIIEAIPALTVAVVDAQLKDDPSYNLRETGAADVVRGVGDALGNAVTGAAVVEDDLPIRDYGRLTADEIAARLPELSQAELARVDAYERRHDNRTTVLGRIETLRGDEPWPGYDELTVSEVQKAFSTCNEDQIKSARAYESGHKNRAGVLKATERVLAKSS